MTALEAGVAAGMVQLMALLPHEAHPYTLREAEAVAEADEL